MTYGAPNFSAVQATAAKHAGQQLTLDVNTEWKHNVMVELRCWLDGQKAAGITHMTMEEFRAVARNQPSSSNAWGTLPVIACRRGLLAPMTHADGSPVMRPAASVKTHAHPIRLWRLL